MRPKSVTLYEVGPRDGLQAEGQFVPTEAKLSLIRSLSTSGLRFIEATSCVSPKWVPQMADAEAILDAVKSIEGVHFPVLTPNLKGFETALAHQAQYVAIFAAASESFSQKNINCSISESLERFKPLMQAAKAHGLKVRGYVSCVLGCPYEGAVAPEAVLKVSQALLELGCYEISLGDTIGVGTIKGVETLLRLHLDHLAASQLAVHFHDTYGQALANILIALDHGIATIDSSVGGLGGCPYAPGASGNVATEDVLYLLNGLDIETGVDMQSLIKAAWEISDHLKRPPRSKLAHALGRPQSA